MGLLRVAAIVPMALLLLLVFQPAGGAHQAPQPALAATGATTQGDVDCNGSIDSVDSLQVLRRVAGLSTSANCLDDAGDVDCNSEFNSVDALRILRYVAGLNAQTPAGCPPINALLPGTSPQDAADLLSARITGGGNLMDVIEAVQESMARGGVSTGDGKGTTYTQAFEPTAASVAIPLEVLDLALEARGATSVFRMDAAQLGQMLSDFGWPFYTDSTPGEQIVAMLREFVIGAQALPADPNSFTPLFLQAMGRIQDPAVDLSAGDTAPENVHFNLLELRLFVALFERQAVYPNQPASALAAPAAGEPCTEAKEVLSGVLGPFGGQVHGVLTNEAGPHFIEQGLRKAGASAHTAEKVGKALEALQIAAKIWKLIDFYSSTHVAVSIIDGSNHLHKPLDTDPDENRTFDAVAGVSQADWDAYKNANSDLGSEVSHAVRDCLNQLGLKAFSDLGDIVKDAEHWKVDWSISNDRDNSRHEKAITWFPEDQESGGLHLGNWRSDMTQTSDHSYEAAFVVRIGTETAADHLGHPDVRIDDVWVCGTVFSAEVPDLQMLVNAMKGPLGLTDSIVDLGAGWLRTVAGPESCRTLTVLWHESCALAPQSADAEPSPASQAQPGRSVAIHPITSEAITSLNQLPCTWTGTSTASTHYFGTSGLDFDEVGSVTASFTFGNPQRNGVEVKYQITGGQAQWHASGHYSSNSVSCPPFSKGGTQGLSGQMTVAEYTPGHLTYSIDGWMNGQDRAICSTPNQPGINTNAFLETFLCDAPLLTGESLSGSCQHDDTGLLSAHLEYDWNLTSAGCQPSPQPVCQ